MAIAPLKLIHTTIGSEAAVNVQARLNQPGSILINFLKTSANRCLTIDLRRKKNEYKSISRNDLRPNPDDFNRQQFRCI
jgi:hypothetical protein